VPKIRARILGEKLKSCSRQERAPWIADQNLNLCSKATAEERRDPFGKVCFIKKIADQHNVYRGRRSCC
jgi:hypothetical protein